MEQPDTRTPDQLQADYYQKSYTALYQMTKSLNRVRGWMDFFGILVILALVLELVQLFLSF